MTPTTKQYYAFISYKRDDQKWAEWLQEKLEHYKLPSNLNGRDSLPKEIRPIFRDKSELAAGVLADEIQKALDNSKYLIVICSPHSAKSEWVNKEVQAFIESGRVDKIIPFIIEGVPNSGNDETECFPQAIRELPAEDELLGVNINEMGRDAAAVKVIAQMFGLRFDDLWQRHEREKKRRRNWIITASVAAFLVMVGIAGWIWHQNVKLKEKDWKMMESQSKLIAEKAISNVSENSYLTRNIALDLLPKDLSNPDRPYTSESELMLREAMKYNTSKLVKSDSLDKIQILDFHPKGKQFLFAGEHVRADSLIIEGDDYYDYGKRYLFVCDVETFDFRVVSEADHNYLYNCSYSPDGKNILIYNSIDSTLRFFDSETLESLKVYNVGKKYKYTTYFHDGRDIICRNDTMAGIYDAETGQELRTINYPKDVMLYWIIKKEVYGDKIITKESDSIINVISITDGKLLYSFVTDDCYCYNKYDYDIGISPDGRYLACNLDRIIKWFDVETECGHELDSTRGWLENPWKICQPDGTIVIFDLTNGKEHGRLSTCGSCFFSPDGKNILTAYKKTISIWDVETCERIQVIEIDDRIADYRYSPDGNFIAYNYFCGYYPDDNNKDTYIKVCDSKTGKEVKAIKCSHFYDYFKVAPDGKSIIYGDGSEIGICDLNVCDNEMILSKFVPKKVVLSSDKKLIAIKSEDTIMSVIDTESGEVIQSIQAKKDDFYLSFDPDGKSLIYKAWGKDFYNTRLMRWHFDTSNDTTLVDISFNIMPDSIYNYDKDCYVFDTDSIRLFVAGSCNINYNDDGSRYVTTYDYNNKTIVGVWDAETMTELKTWNSYAQEIMKIFAPDGKDFILQVGGFGNYNVLNTDNNKRLVLRGATPYGCTFSPDGKIVVAGVFGGLEIFSAEDGRLLQKVEGHADKVNHVGYSLDGKHLVTASDDKTIRVWNPETWKCVHVIDNFTDAVVFADFTPDGKHIISASQDSTIRLWDFPPLQELIDQTRERFKNRPLTEEERKMYYLE